MNNCMQILERVLFCCVYELDIDVGGAVIQGNRNEDKLKIFY